MKDNRTLDPQFVWLADLHRDHRERLGDDHPHTRFLMRALIGAMPDWFKEELRKEGVACGVLPPVAASRRRRQAGIPF